MEWYEIQTAYEISQKVFSTGPINNSPKTDFFLLETIYNISDFFCQILLCSKPTLDSLKEAIQKRIEDFKEEWKEILSIYKYVIKEDGINE